ncbi:putative LRR receptor-like serine/threonine-protein kinase [Hibiscus syriacus]|uniref:LRR receptor-like serine/threonine-protein kinase n=1 Tax=Hibiscus syriacus TaxID=106335 RepID=A0A6A3APJ7_HIBSY|nr:cold-responsive protein kinase 1-like isoform X2 [Hibiscus syriacus]KAE8705175.1 putative LRR receptor-like serine/threonine-protein kinase [Hibiscus syriacus]
MSCFSFLFSRKKRTFSGEHSVEIDEEVLGIQNTKMFTYKELKMATGNFHCSNKIGSGGFGVVYKGTLRDGTMVAIKVLSADSKQGVREFLTEINVIADIAHANLVELYGCCVEGKHRILVYSYLENNSLAQTLLGGRDSSMQFSWQARRNICIGVAKGLAFLHEEVQPHVVHRDIKASNILLDKNLNPKISDFGLAKLFPDNMTHISTRVAGTTGYLAPEYAIRGRLTRKADIYSFGVLLLEIVCGRCNTNRRLPVSEQFLLEKVWNMYGCGQLLELVDPSLNGDFNDEEAQKFLKIGLLCTQDMSKLRPSMSQVVKMLMGEEAVNDQNISKPGLLSDISTLRDQKDKSSNTSEGTGKGGTSSSSSENIPTSHATMTFNSIFDRSD